MSENKQNCPNCGAPYEIEKDKCPYCGTAYFDMSTLNFDEPTPIFLKFRFCGYEFTQKCIPKIESIIEERDIRNIYDSTRQVNISFDTVPLESGGMFTVKALSDKHDCTYPNIRIEYNI